MFLNARIFFFLQSSAAAAVKRIRSSVNSLRGRNAGIEIMRFDWSRWGTALAFSLRLRCEADLFQLSNAALTASPLYLEFLFAQLQEQKPEPHVLLVAVLNANSECSKCCTSYNKIGEWFKKKENYDCL